MRMVWSEWKKIVFHKNVFLLLLFMLCVNGYKIYQNNANIDRPEHYEEEVALNRSLFGEMTADKVQKVIASWQEEQRWLRGETEFDWEKQKYSSFYENMKYQYEYHQTMEEQRKQLQENQDFYRQRGNQSDAAVCGLMRRVYQNRAIDEYYDADGFISYLSYEFSGLCLLLFLFPVLFPVFLKDRKDGVEPVFMATAAGRKKLYFCKWMASVLTVVVAAALFLLEDFAGYSFANDFWGYTNPLYSIREYRYTVFSGSILSCLLCRYLTAVLGLVTITSLWHLANVFFNHYSLALFFNIVVTVLLVIASEYGGMQSFWPLLNPVVLLKWSDLTREFQYIRLFGIPILSVWAGICGAGFLNLLCLAGIHMGRRWHHVTI